MIPFCILAIEDDSDREFMTRLFQRYNRLIYCEISKIIGNKEDVEDALQTTLVKLIKQVGTLRTLDRDRLVNYIITASKNTALSELRRRKRHPVFSFDDCIDCPDLEQDRCAVEEHMVWADERASLARIWPKLDERSRYLLKARYVLGNSMEEIAREMDVKPGSVRMALTRARRAAAQLLEEEMELT